MFQHLTGQTTLRSSAAVASQTDVAYVPFDTRQGTHYVVIIVAGRTQGTLTPSLMGSFDGGSTYETIKTGAAISADGVAYLEVPGPLPPNLRVRLVPAASFDGLAGVKARAGGLVS